MVNIRVSKYYDVAAERVWERVEDFYALHTWLPTVRATERDATRPNVRRVTRADGIVLLEELVAQSDEDRSVRYRIVDGDLPIRGFAGHLAVHEGTAPDRSSVTWDVTFETDAPVEEISATLSAALDEGLERLSELSGASDVR